MRSRQYIEDKSGFFNKLMNLIAKRKDIRDDFLYLIDDIQDNIFFKIKQKPFYLMLPLGLLILYMIFSMKGGLTIETNLKGTQLYLSGVNETFVAPLVKKRFMAGTYTVTINKAGYEPISEDVSVNRLGNTYKYFELKPDRKRVQPVNKKPVKKNPSVSYKSNINNLFIP